jgi:hypothetical protein
MIQRGVCEFCKRGVFPNEKAAFRVRGWEIERDQGGANSIVGRERQPDRIVHALCVKQHERLGAQESML